MVNLSWFGGSRKSNVEQRSKAEGGRGGAASRRLAAAITGVLLAGLGSVAQAQAPVGQSSFAQYLATVTTTAGNTASAVSGGDGGPAASATFVLPTAVAYDAAGNLYICDKTASVIRKVSVATGIITTVAGTGVAGAGTDNVAATSSQLNLPQTIFVDPVGNIYIYDSANFRIRFVNAQTGIITTLAGTGVTGTGGDGGPAISAQIANGNGVWLDAVGNIFIADSGNAKLREISGGIITTIAGTGKAGNTGNGGLATLAAIQGPRTVSVDPRGNIYPEDRQHYVVRIITLDGLINAFAGNAATGNSGDGGPAKSASFSGTLSGAIPDDLGNVFITDAGNNSIRVVDRQTGNISTLSYLVGGAVSTSGTLNVPQGFAFGPNGQFAIADSTNHLVRTGFLQSNYPATAVAASSPQTFTLLVSTGDTLQSIATSHASPADFTVGTIGNCALPGAIAAATTCTVPVTFNPTAPGLRVSQVVTTDATGGRAILPVTGVGNAPAVTIRPGIISTVAVGTGAATPLAAPSNLALDSANNLYTVNGDNTVRVTTPAGVTTVFAGTLATAGFAGDGGVATAATLSAPSAVAIDTTGNVYIADTGNNVIREVGAESGIITTLTYSSSVATGSVSLLKSPRGVATDLAGNLYIADTGNHVIRELNRFTGLYSILAGTPGVAMYSGDNGPATSAFLSSPTSLFIDAAGNIYFTDSGNSAVRKITAATGVITTVAGGGTASPGDGGAATAAALSNPGQIAVDAAGDLYIAGIGSNKIRFVSAATGIISTLAGTGTAGNSADGTPATSAMLSAPAGLAVDQLADVFIADTGNNRVAKIGGTTTTLSFGSVSVGGMGSQTATLTNFGNQPLTLGVITFSAGFLQQPTPGGGCTAGATLAPGASCTLTIGFSPTVTGPATGTATIQDNALNNPAATQTITLVGTGAAGPASIVVASGGGQTITPYTQFPAPLVASVLDSKGTPISGITVTFTAPATGATGVFANGTNTATAVSDSSGHATVTFAAGATRGTFSVSASVISVAAAATFTETIAGNPSPTLTLTYTPATNPITYGSSITLNASATPPGSATATVTGTVTFLDGGAAIKTATLVNGAASYTFVPAAGSHSYTLSYGGDANYSANTTTAPQTLTVNQYNITANGASTSFVYGSPVPTLTGSLAGVLPMDVGNVVATFMAQTSGANITSLTPVGNYPIATVALTGSAAGNYKVTMTTGTVTITQAASTNNLSVNYPTAGPGFTITFTDVLGSTTTGQPAGSVSFYDGTMLLGSVTSSGSATFPTSTLALGPHNITAVYMGSSNFTGSTSNVVTVSIVPPDLAFAVTPASATVVQGGNAVYPFTLTALGSLTTPVTLSCSALPANAVCTFTPPTFTPTVALPSTSGQLSIATEGAGNLSRFRLPARPGTRGPLVLAGILWLPFAALLIPGLRKRRTSWRRLVSQALVALLAVCALVQLDGCSSNSGSLFAVTPTGTTTVMVTATSGTIVRTTTVTLNVVQHF